MLGRSLLIIFFFAALLGAVGFWLHTSEPEAATGIFWGLGGGLVCAISAVGAAHWAESRKMSVQQALAVVVVGMLFRMLFLGGWTLIAILWGGAGPLTYILGFGTIYLVGQVLEVWSLSRLRRPEQSESIPAGTSEPDHPKV